MRQANLTTTHSNPLAALAALITANPSAKPPYHHTFAVTGTEAVVATSVFTNTPTPVTAGPAGSSTTPSATIITVGTARTKLVPRLTFKLTKDNWCSEWHEDEWDCYASSDGCTGVLHSKEREEPCGETSGRHEHAMVHTSSITRIGIELDFPSS
ncbi:hypothetical protein BDU57DRAFT_209824 [Ampelomyces quisqualis]|uniref:Uncharacterized protein n=1 Tax=Ampelomyces quisqualis TaxID=50730 RepID=A0A6A5QLX7_AMPQU|nr:hypothetical protein BDU57DRAFT_209824 [Ampelomyces quisqualis]